MTIVKKRHPTFTDHRSEFIERTGARALFISLFIIERTNERARAIRPSNTIAINNQLRIEAGGYMTN